MRFFAYKKKLKFALSVAFGLAIIILVVWVGGKWVFAQNEIKTVFIFPTSVFSEGWQNENNALNQELSENAPIAVFSEENSSFIVMGGGLSENISWGTIQAENIPAEKIIEESATTTESILKVPTAEPLSMENEALSVDESVNKSIDASNTANAQVPTIEEKQPDTLILPDAQEFIEEQVVPAEAPLAATTTSSAIRSYIFQFSQLIFEKVSSAFSNIVSTVLATTTQELSTSTSETQIASSTKETVLEIDIQEDVSVCGLLGKECHTIEFSGFGIDGQITEKKFKKVALNFSFAGISFSDASQDDKLLVRYFHDNRWHDAGRKSYLL